MSFNIVLTMGYIRQEIGTRDIYLVVAYMEVTQRGHKSLSFGDFSDLGCGWKKRKRKNRITSTVCYNCKKDFFLMDDVGRTGSTPLRSFIGKTMFCFCGNLQSPQNNSGVTGSI